MSSESSQSNGEQRFKSNKV